MYLQENNSLKCCQATHFVHVTEACVLRHYPLRSSTLVARAVLNVATTFLFDDASSVV